MAAPKQPPRPGSWGIDDPKAPPKGVHAGEEHRAEAAARSPPPPPAVKRRVGGTAEEPAAREAAKQALTP